MRTFVLWWLLFCGASYGAQERVYLSSGQVIEGKVEEVGPELLIINVKGDFIAIPVSSLVLVHYRNNEIQVFSPPEKDQVYYTNGAAPAPDQDKTGNNLFSFNALALTNSDVAFSFERLLGEKNLGVGAYGGYNFNSVTSAYNAYLFQLHNSKKTGDLCVFANYYKRQFKKPRTFYYGVLVKYSQVKFSSVIESAVTSGTITTSNITYKPATGHQLSFLLTMGHHRQLGRHLYLRSLLGFGFFNLKGELGRQYNYIFNRTRQFPVVTTTLPKLFAGLFIGYRF